MNLYCKKEVRMKKILSILLIALTVLSLCGCDKIRKEEEKPEEPEVVETKAVKFAVTIDRGNGITKDFSVESESDNLLDILKIIKDGGLLEYDITGSGINALDGLKTEGNSKWVLYINDKVYEGDLNTLKITEKDKVLFLYETTEPEQVVDIVGGWEINEDYTVKLSKDEEAIFNEITDEVTGVTYTPIRVVATQAAVGVNYAFLAKGVSSTQVPETNFYIMVVYKDLDGSCELKAINKIDIPDMQTMEYSDNVFLKSWMVIRPEEGTKLKDKNIQKSFEKVMEGYEGLDVCPLELLARQLVAGNNYIALCYGQTVTLDPIGDLYILEWYEDLQGNVSITRLENLNLQYYVAGE